MRVESLAIPDVKLLRPLVHGDGRGFFLEVWNRERYAGHGLDACFVQLNHSRSARGALRGLHFQWERPQGKLVRLLSGEVFDVAVDLRPGSSTFGRWAGARLTAEGHEQMWIPPRFAHGFCVLSHQADFEYLCTEPYLAEHDAALRWNDPRLSIPWPVDDPLLSARDAAAPTLDELRPELERRWAP
jgi:dTDP-4-dehydrorhamnose 3,5-epimerase